AFASFFLHDADGLRESKRLQQLANHTLASEAFWTAYQDFERGDSARCEAYLAVAAATDPSVRSWAAWSNLRWKRLVGPRAWSLARPVVDFLRGKSTASLGGPARERAKDPRDYPFLQCARLL